MTPFEYHRRRRAMICRDYPQVRDLYGPCLRTAAVTTVLVASQFAVAALLSNHPWWWALVASLALGAFVTHRLNVAIHECAHNLAFRSTTANKALSIVANLPGVIPAAIGFRHYHLLHHRFLGQRGLDADVAPLWETRLVGRAPSRKLLWLLALPIVYAAIHPLHVQRPLPLDCWLVANVALVFASATLVLTLLGWTSLAYLAFSSYFAAGPHPTGAHILQEHIVFDGRYETASYYGLVNAVSGNHGFHLEHHDFANVPGSRIGELRRIAAPYYRGRFAHCSRLKSLWVFVTDRRIGLDSRVTTDPETNRLLPAARPLPASSPRCGPQQNPRQRTGPPIHLGEAK